jgi:hypothetical protein
MALQLRPILAAWKAQMPDGAGPEGAFADVSAPHETRSVSLDVAFERSVSTDRWALEQWRVAAVAIAGDGRGPEVTLHRDEAEGYWLNLSTDSPSVFVQWRLDEATGGPIVIAATASYSEAARWMDGGEQVDRAAMPDVLRPWVARFVDAHWRPDAGRRKRRGPKPSFMRGEEFERMTEAERSRLARPVARGEAADGTVGEPPRD